MATKAPPKKATRNSEGKPAAAAPPKSRLVRNVVNAAYLDKPAHLRTRQQRSDAGKALRVSCPRESQAGFKPAVDRTDPIDLLIRSSTGRDEHLVPIRYGRMLKGFRSNGERVVLGQRLMQAASDVFLGHYVGAGGQHMYARQLRDVKIKPMVEIYTARDKLGYARKTGWALARAHARSGDACVIGGYIGKGDELVEAIADFAVDYAAQNQRDHAALLAAVRSGRLEANTDAN